MHPFPHIYTAGAAGSASGDVTVTSAGLPALASAPPVEFNGPGDRWSPETLLVAAVADCVILTFRAIAAASKMPWVSLSCEVVGTLERIDRVTQFTNFVVKARLEVPGTVNEDQARRLVTKADETCLVTRSLKATSQLEIEIVTRDGAFAV